MVAGGGAGAAEKLNAGFDAGSSFEDVFDIDLDLAGGGTGTSSSSESSKLIVSGTDFVGTFFAAGALG